MMMFLTSTNNLYHGLVLLKQLFKNKEALDSCSILVWNSLGVHIRDYTEKAKA